MTLDSELFHLLDTGGAVGAKYKGKYLGHQVTELTAVTRIFILFAFGTRGILIVLAAYFYLAPPGSGIIMASRTFLFKVRTARPAVKSAVRHEVGVRHYFLHRHTPDSHRILHIRPV